MIIIVLLPNAKVTFLIYFYWIGAIFALRITAKSPFQEK